MLIVKALNKIYKGSKCIGWKMMDFNGNVMDATTESIKQAILNGSVNAINLTIANNGELVMINEEVKTHKPHVVFVDDDNKIVKVSRYEKYGKLTDDMIKEA